VPPSGARAGRGYEAVCTPSPLDPSVQVSLEGFTDVVGRNFKRPREGLGFDQSPSAHMWRYDHRADQVPVDR
jgi:hypothetical protein